MAKVKAEDLTAKNTKEAKNKLPESPKFHPNKPRPLAGDRGLPKNPKLKNAKAAIEATTIRKRRDTIVCWRHNWKECPVEIEVVELSRLVGRR